MRKREKGLSDDKILAKYYNFSPFFGHRKEEKEAVCRGVICTMTNEAKLTKITNHEKKL